MQAALRVSVPQDPAEREAASIARRVMHMAPPPISVRSPPAVTRAGEGAPAAAVSEADLAAAASGGAMLPDGLRGFMEQRFRADFSGVRVHKDGDAGRLAARMHARAFAYGNHLFFGPGQYSPDSREGAELIAHELTHTIQQGAVAQPAAAAPAPVRQAAPRQVQRLGLSDALNYLADKANLIPGFRMFTIVLGVNPVNMSRVDRSAANILRALVEFIPGGGLITQALDAYGVFDKAGAYIEEQIRSLGLTTDSIRRAISTFIDSLGLRDLFDLGGVWDRAKRIFTEPIDKLIALGRAVGGAILGFIRDAILKPIAKLAEGTRGWDLLIAVLGRNPITGEAVPRNADTLIGGFMKLIGQEEVWENLKKANAVARAWAWFQTTLAGVMAFVQAVPERFMATLRSLEIADLVLLPRAFQKVGATFGGFVADFIGWAGKQVLSLLEIIFDVLAPAVMPYLRKAAAAFQTIIRDPVRFIGNLVRAGIQGFKQFAANFLSHLRKSLIDWLTGSLGGANIYIPQAFNLQEIVKFVLSVLGLTWASLRAGLVKAIGEPATAVLEKTFDIVITLVQKGPGAAWEKIVEAAGNLRDMVMEQVMAFVRDSIVQAAVTKLLTSLNPAGAFIQAVIAVYNTVMFFVERLKQIGQVAAAVIDAISAIAAGVIQPAADRVERTMAGLLTLVISFLARIAGLGKVSDEVIKIINKVRAPIEKARDKLIEWIVATAKKLGKLAAQGAAGVIDWWKEREDFANKEGEKHTLTFSGTGDAAKLIIASDPRPVAAYLDEYPDKSSADYRTARSVFEASNRVIFTSQKKNAAERERRAEVKNELAKISRAFARLAGTPPKASDYPKTTAPLPSGPPPSENSVEYIIGEAKSGSEPGKGRNTGTVGWAEVYDANLTTSGDKWVQMHVISAQLGGKGEPGNLVPAPNSINTGPFRTFERSVKTLAAASSGGIKNVVWVTVRVSYHDGKFASAIQGQAGLYFWKGTGSPKWLKNTSYSLFSRAGIPRPDLQINKKYSLNYSSGTMLGAVIKDGALVDIIKARRIYSSMAVFQSRVTESAQNANIPNYATKIAAILSNPKIVLSNVEPSET